MNAPAVVNDILEHHGIKGMKWGVRRKATVGAREVVVSDKRKKIKTSGGGGHSAHPEAVRARTIERVAKKSGTKALSNTELQALATRLNLEQSVSRLQTGERSASRKFVQRVLVQSGEQLARQAVTSSVVKLGKTYMSYT